MGAIRRIINRSGKISWQFDYYDPLGKRVRLTFKKKKEAEDELAARMVMMAENRYLDVRKDFKTTLKELIENYCENFRHQENFKNAKSSYLKNFEDYFGCETLLSKIRYVNVETYRSHLKQKLTRSGTIRSRASINREMSCLHHIFLKAVELEMIERSPFDRGKSLILKENNSRLRYLTQEEIGRLLDACSTKVIEYPEKRSHIKQMTRRDPDYLREIVECALYYRRFKNRPNAPVKNWAGG
jgi:hypothetical protein